MEQQEKPSNEEEKQNPEEEEFDEEDEEEKEGDKNHKVKEESKKEAEKNDKEQQKEISTEKEDKSDKNQDNKETVKEVNQNKEENKIQDKLENNNVPQDIEKNNDKNKDEKLMTEEKNDENINKEEEEEKEESSSSYILKYVRKSNEPRESAYDKELIKSKKCLYMIEFKIIRGKTEKYLLVYCHEIAAIYFDEIYEKKYSIKDLYKENRHFRIFDEVDEAKNIIDEILNNNATNTKKIFIECQYNIFKLHLKISFFDKENEVVLNIPKKDITDKERIRLLPDFLKEIQIKMNHLEEDNKKLKNEYKNMGENSISGNGIGEGDEFFGENKKTKLKGTKKKQIKK